jgi:acyl-CoA synthetase (NDP forming)
LDSLMAHPECGSLLVTIILSSAQSAIRKMPPVLDVLRHWSRSRTVLFAMLGEDTAIPTEIVSAVRAAGVPFFRSPERALRALARFTAWADRVPSQSAPPPVAIAERLRAGIHPEYAAKDILERAGLPMPRRRLVADVEAALTAAREIGFPVVLKIQSAALSHKSEAGGVILGLANEDALRAGWELLHANVRAAAAGAKIHETIDGVLIEAMSRQGLELILGGRRDPDWGSVLAVGLGGIFAEALGDVRLMPADLTVAGIKTVLGKLKGAALLGPFRGKPARDLDAVASAAALLGAFMRAHPEVREVDINPLIVFGEGQGALALDALISCH